MDDEIREFADGRPAAPPYREEARAAARERLVSEARGGGGFRFPRIGWQVAAAFGVTVVLVGGVAVAMTRQGDGPGQVTSVVASTASAAGTELSPRPGQFVMVESDTMYEASAVTGSGKTRHLYRTHRKIWQSVDGRADGLLLIESLPPKPWPGESLPASVADGKGSSWMRLATCPDRLGQARRDYAYLSTLPADSGGMRDYLYRQAVPADGPKKASSDEVAFQEAQDLLTETYLPRAQRDAMFEAVSAMPGVEVAQGVADSAGRKGVALGRVERGARVQLIFDPTDHMPLGLRSTVVDASAAGAPVGSVIALTARLATTVVDKLPDAPDAHPDGNCAAAPVPTRTVTPSPGPSQALIRVAPTPGPVKPDADLSRVTPVPGPVKRDGSLSRVTPVPGPVKPDASLSRVTPVPGAAPAQVRPAE
jgi:hypothetical protein